MKVSHRVIFTSQRTLQNLWKDDLCVEGTQTTPIGYLLNISHQLPLEGITQPDGLTQQRVSSEPIQTKLTFFFFGEGCR